MPDNLFGPILTGRDVRLALTETIKVWIPDYLAEIGKRAGRQRGSLPVFRSYVPMLDVRKYVEDQMPACIIVAPGTMASPISRARSQDARWAAGIGAVVSGKDSESTHELAELYAAAVRALLLQHKSLGGFAAGLEYISERYQEYDANSNRTITAGIVQVGIDVSAITDPSAGPVTPSEDATVDPGDWPTVETVDQGYDHVGPFTQFVES